MTRKSTIPDDPMQAYLPAPEPMEPAPSTPAATPVRARTARGTSKARATRTATPGAAEGTATHKLTTYLSPEQYNWALDVSHAARRSGTPLTIAEVLRRALEREKRQHADPEEAAQRLVRGR